MTRTETAKLDHLKFLKMKSFRGLLFLLLLLLNLNIFFKSSSSGVDCLKINKNTVEMLNNGLRALLSIKRILSTLKSVNELTGQAFPHLLASGTSGNTGNPKMRLVSKIFGGGGGNSGNSGSTGGGGGGGGKSPLSTASLVEGMAAAVQGKKSNSLGLIKIGEKPPPGLFPETLPYSISGNSASGLPNLDTSPTPSADLLNAVSALTSNSNSNSNNLLSTSELFNKLVAAANSNLQNNNNNFNSDSEAPVGGTGNSGGSTSQLIPHFSATDLKTSSSDQNTRFNLLQPPTSSLLKKAFFPRRLLLPLSLASSPSAFQTVHSNIFNNNNNNNNNDDDQQQQQQQQQMFEGTFEVLQN